MNHSPGSLIKTQVSLNDEELQAIFKAIGV